jgi:hypothetical protein
MATETLEFANVFEEEMGGLVSKLTSFLSF